MMVAVSFIHSFIHCFLLSPCLGEETESALCSRVSDSQLPGGFKLLSRERISKIAYLLCDRCYTTCSQHGPDLPSPSSSHPLVLLCLPSACSVPGSSPWGLERSLLFPPPREKQRNSFQIGWVPVSPGPHFLHVLNALEDTVY